MLSKGKVRREERRERGEGRREEEGQKEEGGRERRKGEKKGKERRKKQTVSLRESVCDTKYSVPYLVHLEPIQESK